MKAVGEGEVTITVNAAETVNYKSASTDVKLNVKERSKEKTDLSGKAVLYTSVTTYDGTAKEPKVKVMVKDTLKENVDYIVSYENNINAGEGTIIIQGIVYSKINTKGYGKITYESDNNDIASISQGYLNTYAEGEVNVKVTAEGDNNHNPASTTLTVKISDTEQRYALKLQYSNNVNVGTATVTITGKGDYRGTITHTFSIKKAANKITANKRTYTVVGNLSKSVTAKISAKAAYGKLKYVSDNSKVVVSSSGKVTIPKGFSGMSTVTLTSKSTKNYSSASCKISVVINPAATKFSSVKAGNKKITLKWKKNRSARGYEIQYLTDAAFRSDVVKKSVNKNTTSLTLKKLTSGSKYYIRIRAVNKFKYKGKSRTIYSTWTNVTKSC